MSEANAVSREFDVVVIGAGAAGMFCAIEAAKRGRRVLVIDHSNKAGKKILMSGGGRCNFTNMEITPDNYLSKNPNFCRSALKRYTQWDFIGLVAENEIPYHEKELGQLFCDNSAKDIQQLLLKKMSEAQVQLKLDCSIQTVNFESNLSDGGTPENKAFQIASESSLGIVEEYEAESIVVACGSLSIPTMGATDFGFKLAEQFGHNVLSYRASLVPFTWNTKDKSHWSTLSGVSLPISVSSKNDTVFSHDALITHRGLSGPAMLQISNYWQPGETLLINWLPNIDVSEQLKTDKHSNGKKQFKTWLANLLPGSLAELFVSQLELTKTLAELNKADIENIAQLIHCWVFSPGGTEGYRTAEVTIGGVDTDGLSSKTMESNLQPNLYFIGEVVDVTGWLGGYNFQWAWSSGWAAGQVC